MQGNMLLLIIMMIVMFALMIIPQRKRDKQKRQMLAALQVGDTIRTIGGIIGKVAKVKDDEILIYTGIVGNPSERSLMRFSIGAVETVIKKGQGGKEVEDTDNPEEDTENETLENSNNNKQ